MSNRRTFLERMLAGVGGMLAVSAGGAARAGKLAVRLDQLPTLKQVGGSVIVKLEGEPLLLVRRSVGEVRALSPICTHRQCYVSYNSTTRRVECGCHHSGFDLRGRVLYGPAPSPLPRYEARLDGDRIIVELP
ncbi:MAG: Rieske (2Fe-2S) protein [Polyangia bacterium]